MAGTGPAHLFVYYQKPYRMNEQGEIEELRQPAEFIVTDGKFKFLFECVGAKSLIILFFSTLNFYLLGFLIIPDLNSNYLKGAKLNN